MKKGKIIAGVVWLIVGALLIAGLIMLIQRLIISGTDFVNELGGMLVEENDILAEPTSEPMVMTEDDFNAEPVVTMEPEELFSIPVEETIEELAKENEQK